MKIELKPKGQETFIPVEIETQASGYQIQALESRFQVSLNWDSPHGGWARENLSGSIHRFYSWLQEEQIQFWLDGRIYHFERQALQTRRGTGAGVGLAVSSGEIKAPMPGSVLKVLVEPGAVVTANQALLIMESMKMEMTLTCPGPGTVEKVVCQAGQMVEMNALLIHVALETTHDVELA